MTRDAQARPTLFNILDKAIEGRKINCNNEMFSDTQPWPALQMTSCLAASCNFHNEGTKLAKQLGKGTFISAKVKPFSEKLVSVLNTI